MIDKGPQERIEITRRLKDTAAVTAALKRAAGEAVREHARAGRKIVVWRNNQVMWEDPDGDEIATNQDTDD